MDKDKIEKYFNNGGQIWGIENITTMRDGGTIMLMRPAMLKLNPFYVDKDDFTIHTEYPPTKDNLLTDEPTKEYLYERLDSYLESCKFKAKRAEKIINKLKRQVKTVSAFGEEKTITFPDWAEFHCGGMFFENMEDLEKAFNIEKK